MSDTKEPSDLVHFLVLVAIVAAIALVQELRKRIKKYKNEEPPYMTELLARAAQYIPRHRKCTTNQQQQDACTDILEALSSHQDSTEISDVERIVRRTLTADTFAYSATLYTANWPSCLREASNNLARIEYDETTIFAETAVAAVHPERLRLAIKYSTFLRSACKDKRAARRISSKAWLAAFSSEAMEARRERGEELDLESKRLRGLLWKVGGR